MLIAYPIMEPMSTLSMLSILVMAINAHSDRWKVARQIGNR